jgi:twitching motility protein PilI
VKDVPLIDLRALRDQPFELLAELEKRGRAVSQGGRDSSGREWVGIGFRLGSEAFVVPREDIREVMAVPPMLTRVPGARTWIRGLANLRGQLLPIVDLRQFLGSGATASTRVARVLVVNHRDVPSGLLVDEVSGFRRFYAADFVESPPPTLIRCERYLAGAYRYGADTVPVLSVRRLIDSPAFLQAAA